MSHLAWRTARNAHIALKRQQRSTAINRNASTHRDAPTTEPAVLQLSINANLVTQLRHLVMCSCGDMLTFMRVQPIAHATKMKVWLCVSQSTVAFTLQMALRAPPGVELTHFIAA